MRGEQRLREMLRALRSRNYRLFFTGQAISLIGTWLQIVATSWLVYRLTGSTWWLGLSAFASRLPSVLLTPLAGVVIDRVERKRVVIASQSLAAVQAAILAWLTLSGTIQPPGESIVNGKLQAVWVVLLGSLLGIANAFDVPARQAMVVQMVDRRDDVGNAIALNSTIFNGAKLVGPAVAGFLIARFGEGACFGLNALSYVAVLWALHAMRLDPEDRKPGSRLPYIQGLLEGLHYAWTRVPVRALILLVATAGLLATPQMVLLPKLVAETLRGDERSYGLLMTAQGLGALWGAMFLASRTTARGLERVIPFASLVFASAYVGLALSRAYWQAWLLMILSGTGGMLQMAASNTLLQALVDDDKRGRVMSLFALGTMGTVPLGGVLAGWLGAWLSVPHAMLVCGLILLTFTLWFLSYNPRLRIHVDVMLRDQREPVPGLQAGHEHEVTSQGS